MRFGATPGRKSVIIRTLLQSHGPLLKVLGETMVDFVENLDYIHTYMMAEYPDVGMPHFRCEAQSQGDTITLHYYSTRPGLDPFMKGRLSEDSVILYFSRPIIFVLNKNIEKFI